MKFHFAGGCEGLLEGLKILGADLGFKLSSDGIPVEAVKRPGNLEIVFENGKGVIKFAEKIHFFRAVGLLLENLQKSDNFHITEEPQFLLNGIMLDVSRNAVMTVEGIKKLLVKMAAMGLNMMQLYTEDTYEIPGKPYFGYMRGRYSKREIMECDDFADLFGIEIVPCIQTLAHLKNTLKWDYAVGMRDTEDILLADSEKTYEFVEEMIKAASGAVRSKKIHIGMDEAHDLGRGKYLDKNGLKDRFEILNRHLSKVLEITDRYGLEAMMWSDMYFRLGSKTREYYDNNAQIPKEAVEKIPKNVGLVYWDYYHSEEEDYSKFIELHKDMKREILFAGGIWTWNGHNLHYKHTFKSTNSALAACKKHGIQKVFATMWGDNGVESNFFSALLGMQLYAEHGYAKELDEAKLKRRFEFCVKGDFEAFMDLGKPDEVPAPLKVPYANPSKYLLWQDILTGLFDKHVEGITLNDFYKSTEETLKRDMQSSGQWAFLFDVPYKLCRVLSVKAELGLEIRKYYLENDKEALNKIADNALPELYERVSDLRFAHREQWFKYYKPFGWEILDIRYGGLLARVDSAKARISDYVNGKIEKIEELEEERLLYGRKMSDSRAFNRVKDYSLIISANPI